jgi:hypothetical protein
MAGFGALLLFLFSGPVASSQGGNLQQGLLGYWPFDGDGTDGSGGGRNLGLVGGAGFANGLFGKALDLHGNSSQYAVRPGNDTIYDLAAGDFSVQVWVDFNTTSAEETLIEKFTGSSGPGWTMTKLRVGDSRGSNSLQFYASPAIVLNSNPPTLATGVWHQYVVRRSGSTVQILLDGSVVGNGSASGSIPGTTMPLLVGRRTGGQYFPVDGRIDEVAIWSRALSDGEVAYLYNGGQGNRVISGSGAVTPPAAPTDLVGMVYFGYPILLSWTDNSSDEDGFEVERRTVDTAFARVATTGPGIAAYQDAATDPEVAYTYRVRAKNSAGTSAYSNDVTVTSSPALPLSQPPWAPSGLVVVSATRDSVDLSWTDNSTNEVGFEVDRRSGNGDFVFVAMTEANASSFQDTGLPPAADFVYGVRAVSTTGASVRSEADATTLPTLGVTTLRGDLKDSPKFGKDSLKFTASYEFLVGESDGAADPVAEGIALRAGTAAAPVVMKLPPQAEGWKGKGSKWTWKSPRGSAVKYKVKVDLERRLVTASAAGLELAVPPANPMRVSIAIGNDGGTVLGAWESPKTGFFRLR